MARKNQDEDDSEELKRLLEASEQFRKWASELRKKGADTFMAELRLMPLKAELDYARATQDRKDLKRIERLLRKVKGELEDARRLREVGLAEEKRLHPEEEENAGEENKESEKEGEKEKPGTEKQAGG